MKRLRPTVIATSLLAVAMMSLCAGPAIGRPGDLRYELRSPDPIVFDTFAYNLSVVGDGDQVLIGSPFDDTGEVDTGAAYLYDTTSGNLVHEFLNPTPERGDYYGKAVSSIGNLALIGSAGEDRIFLRDLETTDVIRDIEGVLSGDYFGHSIAPVGSDRILIGALKEDTGSPTAGSAYLYGIEGDHLFTMSNPSPNAEDYFGGVVAASEQLLAVGAKGDDAMGHNSGAVYVFDAATGLLKHTLHAPAATANAGFGTSVQVLDDRVFVGAPFALNDAGLDTGAVYAFDGTTGEYVGTFAEPDSVAGAEFGTSLAVRNHMLLVGAPVGDPDRETGAAYLFHADTGQLLLDVEGPARDNRDRFGDSVAIANRHLVVGAPYDDRPAVKAGVAYIFAGIPEPSSFVLLIAAVSGISTRRNRTYQVCRP